jgi:hypothetical protein
MQIIIFFVLRHFLCLIDTLVIYVIENAVEPIYLSPTAHNTLKLQLL